MRSAGPIADVAVNLACSGATAENVFRASNGGVAYKGEAPQADQLAAVAASHDVKLIALSVGGNDLGFADIIKDCAYDFIIWNSYCYDDQQSGVDQKIDGVMAKVGKSVDEIRAVMRGAGYADSSYRIVLQSYPSPIPRGAENRYTQSDWSRLQHRRLSVLEPGLGLGPRLARAAAREPAQGGRRRQGRAVPGPAGHDAGP